MLLSANVVLSTKSVWEYYYIRNATRSRISIYRLINCLTLVLSAMQQGIQTGRLHRNTLHKVTVIGKLNVELYDAVGLM